MPSQTARLLLRVADEVAFETSLQALCAAVESDPRVRAPREARAQAAAEAADLLEESAARWQCAGRTAPAEFVPVRRAAARIRNLRALPGSEGNDGTYPGGR